MKLLLKILATFLILVIVAILGLAFIAYSPLPSDEEMVALYRNNVHEYENRTNQIRASIMNNESFGSHRDEALGYYALDVRKSPFSVFYYTHSSGIGVGAYGTGLAYFDEAPDRIYENLSAMKPDASAAEGFRGYAPIDGHWYYAFWEAD